MTLRILIKLPALFTEMVMLMSKHTRSKRGETLLQGTFEV